MAGDGNQAGASLGHMTTSDGDIRSLRDQLQLLADYL
jgi:hypothetical protein